MPESEQNDRRLPQLVGSGNPPKPPKRTTPGAGEPSPEWPSLFLPDPVPLLDLASALRQQPIKIMIDLYDMGLLIRLENIVQFSDAAEIARKYRYKAERRE